MWCSIINPVYSVVGYLVLVAATDILAGPTQNSCGTRMLVAMAGALVLAGGPANCSQTLEDWLRDSE